MSEPKKVSQRPPRWAEQILQWSCPNDSLEEVQGDLLELYNHWIETVGEREARRRYLFNVIRLQKPFTKLRDIPYPRINSLDMIHHYVTVAWRNIVRNKLYV